MLFFTSEFDGGFTDAFTIQRNYLLVWNKYLACIFHQKPKLRPMTISKGMALPSNVEDSQFYIIRGCLLLPVYYCKTE